MTLAEPPVEYQADLQRLRTDFAYFAKKCLKIRDDKGLIVPFALNRAQRYLHERLEKQRRETGKVRALIVKGRQLGSSTYIGGRYFWHSWRTTRALRTFIFTHHDDATANLFGMTQRFYEQLPAPIKPPTKAASAKDLVFADNGCSYAVATAGGREVGRSDTIQLFHGSEVPSWANAETHMISLGPAIVGALESILESTAKGVGNVFHKESMAAIRGQSEYEAIFIPWFWGEKYQAPCPADTPFSDEWLDYGRAHGLTWEQLFWAYTENIKYARLGSGSVDQPCPEFKQEYPATFDEAFQSSGASFIPAVLVMKARNQPEKLLGRGPIILGIDPARDRDRVGIIDRCGRVAGERICEAWPPQGDTVFLAQRIVGVIKRLLPDAVNIDIGGVGAGVYDTLVDMGYANLCNPVNFGSAPVGLGPTGDKMYANRRAEMWDEMRDWFGQPGGVQIPDRDDLHADVTAPVWGPGATRERNNALLIEEKEKIKERLGSSPDLGDALALTFSVPFAGTMQSNNVSRPKRKVGRGGY